MKKLLFISLFLFLASFTANAQSQDSRKQDFAFYNQKQNDLEFKRLNQELAQLKQNNERIHSYIRTLERNNKDLEEKVTKAEKRVEDLIDLWVNFENVSLPNLSSADKSLAERIDKTNKRIDDQTNNWNWGELSRSCEGLGDHQQVKTIETSDKTATIKYLCFDGKAIHLKTESNMPPSLK